jgi:hypothetical protein
MEICFPCNTLPVYEYDIFYLPKGGACIFCLPKGPFSGACISSIVIVLSSLAMQCHSLI